MKIIQLSVGQMQANCYIVSLPPHNQAVIIDPGDDAQLIMDTLSNEGLKATAMVATHGHFDHIMAAFELQEDLQIPFYIHGQDKFLLDRLPQTAMHFLGKEAVALPPRNISILDGQKPFTEGSIHLRVMETPGHTPGSVCLYHKESKVVFCGDLLFAGGGFGRTDFTYSSSCQLQDSLAAILALPEDTLICCGHEANTTVGEERRYFR